MHPELTNLLTPSAIRALRRTYFMRLATVAVVMAIIALIIHGLLLIPSYVSAHAHVVRQQQELDTLTAQAASLNDDSVTSRIATIAADVQYLGRLKSTPTASGALRSILQVPHPSIVLTGTTFTAAPSAEVATTMTISGTARTREALRQYTLSLENLSYIDKVDLPISAYAKESDIPFTITLTGTFLP